MSGLTDDLKRRVLAEGFDLVGVARAGTTTSFGVYTRWLESNMHGDMAYLSRSAAPREHPKALLDGCRSVVVVAMSYRSSQPASTDLSDPDRVWVSRYAWGRDYHKILRKRLVKVGRWLAEVAPGCAWRACVDTAPVLEREWAARAGLGWIGKSTMLLNRRFGSELFLGVLLTDAELVPDPPATAHCGTCTACLDACPTKALVAPGSLDSRKCIAYLTIEHRGEIEAEQQPGIGRHIAGCDICNEVCPFTQKAPVDLHSEFSPAAHRFQPRIDDLNGLDQDSWQVWRLGSPLKRIAFREFQRNLRIAEQNQTHAT
jgi:epoxyqueuosine reductase